AGLKHWFEFMQQKGWLPPTFSLENMFTKVKANQNTTPLGDKPAKAVQVEHNLAELMDYYIGLTPSKQIRSHEDRLRRWELTRLRNHALVQMLAETGGQISAILSLNVDAFLVHENPTVLEIQGKGGHAYSIVLSSSLPAL